MSESTDQPKVSTLSILKSAMAAMIGVQSNANRERDFKSGKFWHFFVAGIIVTATFMTAVWLAVRYLLATT